jgi:hypothetical protein
MKKDKPGKEPDRLGDLLNKKVRALYNETIKSDGRVSENEFNELERLQRLVEINKTTSFPPRRTRWSVVLILGLTLVIVSILFFARVRSTEIQLDLSLSELSFDIPKQQVFADIIQLSALGVSGLKKIELPLIGDQKLKTLFGPDNPGSSIQLSQVTDSHHLGTITLNTMVLDAGSRVWLRPTEIPLQYRLSLKSKEISLKADVNGIVGVGFPGLPQQRVNFIIPKSILLQGDSDVVDLDISFLNSSKGKFSRQLVIDSLSFFRIDEHFDPEHSVVRRASTIFSGTMYFESLGGRERHIRPGEEIDFELSQGEVRTLELQDDRINFSFHGLVGGMTSGVEEHRYNIMPTYLEWLSASHGLTLLWGTTLYFFGLIFSVWRWWRTAP